MRDVVILSAWYRTLYLQTCFDALCNARGIDNKIVWVFQNIRKDPNVDLNPASKIIAENSFRFPYFKITHHNFIEVDNILGWMQSHRMAWETAYESGAPKVYFFSDDVICTPDFFEWHESIHADGDWFGSTAWRHPQGQTKLFDLEAYYQVSFPNEISMGLCVKHESIPQLLTSYPDWSTPQNHWKIAAPYVQRCYHIGGYSSHLASIGENIGPAIDKLPDPIPDYGRQKVVLKT